MPHNKRLLIGVITYNDLTAKYLPFFLPSIFSQEFKDFELVIADNSDEEVNDNTRFLKMNHPFVKVLRMNGNVGFAKAYNVLINKALDEGYEMFMAINPDMILESDAIKRLIAELDMRTDLGSVCPKIRYWDFENNKKTNIIDTCGILMPKPLRFIDAAQGEEDTGQCESMEIIGPSGAAGIYRLDALRKIKDENGFFDNRMFMYKEDCDLVYRLHTAGQKSECICEALVFHDRTARATGTSSLQIAKNRKNKSKNVKKWSFLNQQLIFCKHWKHLDFSQKISIIAYQFKVLIYTILFEPYLLKELFRIRKLMK